MKLLAALAIALLASCGTQGVINADNIKGTVTTLTTRTESYIQSDAALFADEKVERLSIVYDFRTYVQANKEVKASFIAPSAYRTLEFHDAYIEGDVALQPFERQLALFESKALRGVFDEALRGANPVDKK